MLRAHVVGLPAVTNDTKHATAYLS